MFACTFHRDVPLLTLRRVSNKVGWLRNPSTTVQDLARHPTAPNPCRVANKATILHTSSHDIRRAKAFTHSRTFSPRSFRLRLPTPQPRRRICVSCKMGKFGKKRSLDDEPGSESDRETKPAPKKAKGSGSLQSGQDAEGNPYWEVRHPTASPLYKPTFQVVLF